LTDYPHGISTKQSTPCGKPCGNGDIPPKFGSCPCGKPKYFRRAAKKSRPVQEIVTEFSEKDLSRRLMFDIIKRNEIL
jgi:hypothetical protein